MGERATTGAAVVDDGFMAPVGQAGIKIFPGRMVYNRPRPRISAPPPRREEKWRDFPSSITVSLSRIAIGDCCFERQGFQRQGLDGSHTVQRGQFVTGPGKKRPIKRNSAWTDLSPSLSLSRGGFFAARGNAPSRFNIRGRV